MKTSKKEFVDENVSFGIVLPVSLRKAVEKASVDLDMQLQDIYRSACTEWLGKVSSGWHPSVDPAANVVAPRETDLVQAIADMFADSKNKDGNALKHLLKQLPTLAPTLKK